jgi:hypothetical protein
MPDHTRALPEAGPPRVPATDDLVQQLRSGAEGNARNMPLDEQVAQPIPHGTGVAHRTTGWSLLSGT